MKHMNRARHFVHSRFLNGVLSLKDLQLLGLCLGDLLLTFGCEVVVGRAVVPGLVAPPSFFGVRAGWSIFEILFDNRD